ncbi:claudin-7 [Ciona intestinalis]
MAISSCQIVGYLVGILTWLGALLVVTLPDWKHSYVSERSFSGVLVVRGLWTTCTVKESGSVECINISEPVFALPTLIKGCRTLSVLGTVLAFCAVAITPLGMRCTRIGGDAKTKLRIARCCAVLFGLAAILIGIAVSWYAEDVAKDFHNPLSIRKLPPVSDLKYVYGNALYIGWATMATGAISSTFLVVGSFPDSASENENNNDNQTQQQKSLRPGSSYARLLKSDVTALQGPEQRTSSVSKERHYITVTTNGYGTTGAKTRPTTVNGKAPTKQMSVAYGDGNTLPLSTRNNLQSQTNKTYV